MYSTSNMQHLLKPNNSLSCSHFTARCCDVSISGASGDGPVSRQQAYLGWSSRVSISGVSICQAFFEMCSFTRLSKTHLLSFHSWPRHCQSCWLLSSRQVQCLRNSVRQCLLTSSTLCSCDSVSKVLVTPPSLHHLFPRLSALARHCHLHSQCAKPMHFIRFVNYIEVVLTRFSRIS